MNVEELKQEIECWEGLAESLTYDHQISVKIDIENKVKNLKEQLSEVNKSAIGGVSNCADKGHGICMEKNCNEHATIDYNGHGYWVCDYHYNKLSDEFDEEYS